MIACEKDYLLTDLSHSIPKLFCDALKTGQSDIVRGLTCLAHIMWSATNPGVRLLELIADSRRNGDKYLYELANEILSSINGQRLLGNFEKWGLINWDQGYYVVPDFWDPYVLPVDMTSPDLGIEPMGRLLGMCSLAASGSVAVGLSSYRPVIMLLQKAIGNNGLVSRSDIDGSFIEHGGSDALKRALDIIYSKGNYVSNQRLITGKDNNNMFIVSMDAMRVARLIRERTNNLYLDLGY